MICLETEQFFSINGCNSNLAQLKCGVSEGSIPGPFFLIYINGLHVKIKYSEVHYFADDTNFLNFNSCVQSINKQVNYGLKNLANWLKLNKVSFNVGKTDLVFFTAQTKWKKSL